MWVKHSKNIYMKPKKKTKLFFIHRSRHKIKKEGKQVIKKGTITKTPLTCGSGHNVPKILMLQNMRQHIKPHNEPSKRYICKPECIQRERAREGVGAGACIGVR